MEMSARSWTAPALWRFGNSREIDRSGNTTPAGVAEFGNRFTGGVAALNHRLQACIPSG